MKTAVVLVMVKILGNGGASDIGIADDGPGLPPDVAQAPFEPMRRRRRAASSGSGLGLSIARGIVAAHGGRMELGQPARGTCFRIHLPVENPDPPEGAPGAAALPGTQSGTEPAAERAAGAVADA